MDDDDTTAPLQPTKTPLRAGRPAPVHETEAGFQAAVIAYAQLKGWRVAHFRPARTNKGWITPVAADGAGFPDLVMVRRGLLLFAELKAENGRLTDQQMDWIDDLGAAAPVRIWRPSDWPEIERMLR